MTQERRTRTLTDDDVKAIADAMQKNLEENAKRYKESLYADVGKGFFALIWRGIGWAVLAFGSGYAAHKGLGLDFKDGK